MSQGDGDWAEVGPDRNESKAGNLEQENTELHAQLARCVDVLTWCGLMFGVNDMPKCQEAIHDFIDVELDQQAKADAEVLRCAEELYQLNVRTPLDTESTTDLVREHVNCVKNVVEAVRVAKEERNG